jgi:hypothetical protein
MDNSLDSWTRPQKDYVAMLEAEVKPEVENRLMISHSDTSYASQKESE